MKSTKKSVLVLVIGVGWGLASPPCFSSETSVISVPLRVGDYNNTVLDNFVPGDQPNNVTTTVRWRAGCFGTNLRNGSRPIAPDSTLIMKLALSGNRSLNVECNAKIVTAQAKDSGNCNVVEVKGFTDDEKSKISASYLGQEALIILPDLAKATVDPKTGAYQPESSSQITLKSVSFEQRLDQKYSREYAPQNGVLNSTCLSSNGSSLTSGSACITSSADASQIFVRSDFPGMGGTCPTYLCGNKGVATGFCGSYYSPLMLFFDGKRP
ncbi:MAG: hypothetical protein KGQ59_07185, partial [Bdellovibrionales bacterium]|nr:hypothetical protein [Bdellovibrionales bacterium]